jgi:4-amino-4-deoxy-L-arabinose transferase-like glycosyltransferase
VTDDRADSLEFAGNPWRDALIVIAVSTAIRLAFAAVVPLFPDEAYYWEWSRRLAGGYFDHPPVLAWLIAGGTALFGDSTFGVRFLPILAGTVAMFAVTRTACHLGGSRAARYAALVFAAFPLAATGLVLATPDAPLLAGACVTMYMVIRAIDEEPGSAAEARWWLWGGLAIGVAMASKFTGIFVPFALLLAFVLHPQLRGRFRSPGPWLAVGVAALVMLPVLAWNAQHDWIAFRFQLGHGLGTSVRESAFTREMRLVGGQLAVVTPVLAVLLVASIVRALRPPRDRQRVALAAIACFSALFFVYSATRRSVEANWPAIVWLPAIILRATERRAERTSWERGGVWLAGILSALILLQVVRPMLPLPPRRDPVNLGHGWDGLAASVDSARVDRGTRHVAANRYQDAALLAWHSEGRLAMTALNLGGRRNQYDLWERFTDYARPGDDLLLVLELPRQGIPGPIRRLDGHFAVIDSGAILPLDRGTVQVGSRRLWHLRGWLGTWPADSTDPLRRTPRDERR